MVKSGITLKAVGKWNDRINVPLSNALFASTEMLGKTGYKACEMALVYMAKSAGSKTGKLTKQSIKKRKIDKTGKYGDRIVFREGSETEKKMYVWNLTKPIEEMRTIRLRGLAKRSWMWGLKDFHNVKPDGHAIRNAGDVRVFTGETMCGISLRNKLPYIDKVIVSNLQEVVSKRATNSIMYQVARNVERKFSVEIPRLAAQRTKRAEKKLITEFKKSQRGK